MARGAVRLFVALVAGCATAAAIAAAQPAGPNAAQEVRDYLTRAGASAAEVARVESGQVVPLAFDGPDGSAEIVVIAAVKIRVPRKQVAGYYGQMISYVDGEVTLGFGRFGRPPAAADTAALAFDRGEIDQLKTCRAGRCDIRLGGAGLEALRTAVDWTAPDYVERANAFARKAAGDYMAAYQQQGDAALVTYNDRAEPVSLKAQWAGIVGNSTQFHAYLPELKAYLEQFPRGSLPGGQDVFYWIKEKYGPKRVISLVHGVVYDPPARPDRTIVAQKQIYASHYYDGSLAVATLLDTVDAGRPATYVVYANRSRGDLLKGGFGGLKRSAARTQARQAAEETLGAIKRVLEAAASPG